MFNHHQSTGPQLNGNLSSWGEIKKVIEGAGKNVTNDGESVSKTISWGEAKAAMKGSAMEGSIRFK